MSDTVKKWHEMQGEKILSDQGGEYTVPHKGAEAKEINKKAYKILIDYNIEDIKKALEIYNKTK